MKTLCLSSTCGFVSCSTRPLGQTAPPIWRVTCSVKAPLLTNFRKFLIFWMLNFRGDGRGILMDCRPLSHPMVRHLDFLNSSMVSEMRKTSIPLVVWGWQWPSSQYGGVWLMNLKNNNVLKKKTVIFDCSWRSTVAVFSYKRRSCSRNKEFRKIAFECRKNSDRMKNGLAIVPEDATLFREILDPMGPKKKKEKGKTLGWPDCSPTKKSGIGPVEGVEIRGSDGKTGKTTPGGARGVHFSNDEIRYTRVVNYFVSRKSVVPIITGQRLRRK